MFVPRVERLPSFGTPKAIALTSPAAVIAAAVAASAAAAAAATEMAAALNPSARHAYGRGVNLSDAINSDAPVVISGPSGGRADDVNVNSARAVRRRRLGSLSFPHRIRGREGKEGGKEVRSPKHKRSASTIAPVGNEVRVLCYIYIYVYLYVCMYIYKYICVYI